MTSWLAPFMPRAASAHAGEIDFVMALIHLLMLALFAGWSAYFVFVLVRFRRSRQPQANPQGAGGRFATATEVGVVIAEGAILVAVALPVWFNRTSAPPADTTPVVVRVVGEQFAWNVHHPGADGQFGLTSISLVSPTNPLGLDRTSPFGQDDVTEVGLLHLPVGRPAIVQLSSKDVVHSFGVPAMRVKQDAIPGSIGTVWFTPNQTGEFEIVCSQLCGMAHYRMRGVIIVQTEDEFQRYIRR
jgi:cytochrome c oxidase subunit 2